MQYTPTEIDARTGAFEDVRSPAIPPAPPPPADLEPSVVVEEGEPESDPFPPLSGAVAVSARVPPPSSHMAVASDLPSVIVDVDSEFGTLVDRILSEGGDDQAEAELLRQGHKAMPAIMQRFPGPVTAERGRVEDGAMRAADCGPLLRLIAGERRAALPFVLPLVGDKDVERRYWATFLLTELAYADAVDALVPRLFDAEPSVRKVARLAARAASEVAPDQLVDRLTKYLTDRSAPASRRVEMVEALSELRERLAVPVLIDALGDADDDVMQAARRGLVIVTRQDFARDTKKWNAWWQANAARHRIEWLIDALMHDTPATRRAAGEELKSITKEYFGYYDDLPKRERERAQQRYRDWWNTEGRLRFQRR